MNSRRLILITVAMTALGVAAASLATGATPAPGGSVVAAVSPADPKVVAEATTSAAENVADEAADEAVDEDGAEVEVPITGTDLEKAAAVALAYTGGGRVTETEVGDEESYYEVEVTLDDGRQIDVQLDENFAVVGSESD